MSKKIQVKSVDVLRSLLENTYHPILNEIILWVAGKWGLCITSGWRPGRGVHGTDPGRGMDLRSWFYRPALAAEIEQAINARWIYDPDRPLKMVSWIHESFDDKGKSKGIHFHIQVHPHTRRRA